MIALRRLSTVPTIPELIKAEREAWIARQAARLRAARPLRRPLRPGWRLHMAVCFAAAGLALAAARALLRLGLITPECAARSFGLAARLSEAGLRRWRRHRIVI